MSIEEMKNVDIRTVDPEELVDVQKIVIPEELEGKERLREFIKQVRNPYCYRVGNMIVKNVYSDSGRSIEECVQMMLHSL